MVRSRFAVLASLCAALSAPALANDTMQSATEPTLSLALDGLADTGAACRLTFVVRNGLNADIDALVVEAVAFGPEGSVARISLFDFRDLPLDRLRVRQFDLPGLSCEAIGSVLVNGVQTCEGDGLDPATCTRALAVTSRADVDLLG